MDWREVDPYQAPMIHRPANRPNQFKFSAGRFEGGRRQAGQFPQKPSGGGDGKAMAWRPVAFPDGWGDGEGEVRRGKGPAGAGRRRGATRSTVPPGPRRLFRAAA